MLLRSIAATLLAMLLAAAVRAQAADPLPSWNDGPAKARIVGFVQAVTQRGGKDFVEPVDRVAVFDNDGTLWSEQPMYFQLAFAIDRARAMAKQNPALASTPLVKAAAAGDMKALAATGERGLLELVALTHGGNFELLEWTTAGPGARLGVIVHHDDATREFAYDRKSHVGRLNRGLDEGPARGWTIVSMKNGWNQVYDRP